MKHNEGKKGRSFSGKKALPVFLICLAVLLALIWVIQLIWVKDGYRILKTQMAKSVLHDVCENIDSFDLSVLNIELTSAKIGVKIVDAQGETLVEAGSFHNASLTEYTQEKLAELYRQAESTRGVAWEQVMRFHTVYCKSQDPVQRDYQVLTCAQIAQTAQGEKRMVLLSAEVTPSLILEKMLRLQGMVFSLAAVAADCGGGRHPLQAAVWTIRRCWFRVWSWWRRAILRSTSRIQSGWAVRSIRS